MAKPSRFTEEQKQIIAKLAKHISLKELAELLGISQSYCGKIVNPSIGYLPILPPQEDRRRKLMPDDIENIRWLYAHGITQTHIASIYKVSQACIHYHLLTDEERKEVNKQRCKHPSYGVSSTKEYHKHHAKELYHRKKKLKEKQQ